MSYYDYTTGENVLQQKQPRNGGENSLKFQYVQRGCNSRSAKNGSKRRKFPSTSTEDGKLYVLFGGTYNASAAGIKPGLAFTGSDVSMLAAYAVYILIAAAMTAVFSLDLFGHPCNDLMKLAAIITGKKQSTKKA